MERVILQVRASMTAEEVVRMPLSPRKVEYLAEMFAHLVTLGKKLAANGVKMRECTPSNIGLFPGGHWSMLDFGAFVLKGHVYKQTQVGVLKHYWDWKGYWQPNEDGVRRELMWWLDSAMDVPMQPLECRLMDAACAVQQRVRAFLLHPARVRAFLLHPARVRAFRFHPMRVRALHPVNRCASLASLERRCGADAHPAIGADSARPNPNGSPPLAVSHVLASKNT